MKTSFKAVIITIAVIVLLAFAAIVYAMNQQAQKPTGDGETVRPDSHVLNEGGADAVTLVEFLDFECPSCGQFFPIVEDLREKHEGDITYVVRYFPLPGHINSTQAALAAEAAAQQDRFEDMYRTLFETQQQWSGQPTETPEVFRTLAEDLGLDMSAYDAAVADPAMLERVRSDKADGEALGVQSTPSFFIDGELLQLTAWGDLETAIEKALED
ncbi:MAG: thioredoxin domain-containing protein [Microbacterium sp.]|uniref:DsbA family protein n=1 Tax=Microbacterium sp. TaxID=51671 RepID=UPI001D1C1B4E|nr:thioredoxin domain-containing protein [Microbacterium sp.]MBW8763306.1 thioredoxin domain-containing protein [Microbacterium sp.]